MIGVVALMARGFPSSPAANIAARAEISATNIR